MKANEAPTKIYLDEDKSWHLTNPNGDSTEYIRTDAFIEKTEKWFNEHILDYFYVKEWGQGVGIEGELFDDFKKYIKGE